MKSPSTSPRRGSGAPGATLVEMTVVIGLFGILATAAAFGIGASIENYKRYLFRAERDTLVSLLHKARTDAMNNASVADHGVRIDAAEFVYYRVGAPQYDLRIPRNAEISASGLADVRFTKLTGDVAAPGTITLSDGAHSGTISVNSEGGLNW